MATVRLRHVVEDVDRHGNVRLYVRIPGRPKVRIRATPGTDEFAAAYGAALAGTGMGSSVRRRPALPDGSFGALCAAYFGSPQFRRLDASTKDWRRRALETIALTHGLKPACLMEPRHVRQLRDELADRPGAANNRLKALKALFAWAVEAGLADRNPAREVKPVGYHTAGHHSWTMAEVAQFEARHAIGSKPRLALALAVHTACRREDLTRLGPQHIRDGRLRYTQAKNEHRAPVRIDMPVHPDLAAIIAATPSGHLTFLVTTWGKPFTPAGLGNRFREWCDRAGLPHCSAHGLRKAAASRLAESGATAHEIMAMTGHQTLTEAERYTRAVDRAGLADRAMDKLMARTKP